MKIFAPEYYRDFKCISDKCKNNCCIGWEIDIDGASLERYQKVQGEFGKRLQSCISKGVGDRHFILGEGDRCPFLNENNLCDIYTVLGEDALCNICADHPRFRNFFDGRTEMGLGLCCEAAADLILDWEKPFCLAVIDEDEEEELVDDAEEVFFALRDNAFRIIQDERMSAEECAACLLETFNVCMLEKSFDEWIDIFLGLEILDEGWKNILENAKALGKLDFDMFKSERGQKMQRQLLLYFVYRHTADGIYDGTFGERLGFGVLSLNMIKALCAARGRADFDCFKDIARRYSAEIEYCEENTERLIEVFV